MRARCCAALLDADPAATVYLADLGPAGTLVGASPELLVAREGDTVICQPFAGSAARSTDPAVDRPSCGAGGVGQEPARTRIRRRRDAKGAGPAVRGPADRGRTGVARHRRAVAPEHSHPGRLRETSTTALDLALALHPTPAVGGVPTDEASALIAELEGDRGFYAGAVGWCDARGDGRWVVSIRCAVLSADRHTALAHAGGGIVAESDPDDEVDETTTKFRTILTGLGAE